MFVESIYYMHVVSAFQFQQNSYIIIYYILLFVYNCSIKELLHEEREILSVTDCGLCDLC